MAATPAMPPRDNAAMHLKVGELARQSGLTVRTLHHYDEIGLLVPSGRSDAGYRLYGEADVGRLHAIQALRQLGLPLEEIASLLDEPGASPVRIVEQQMAGLDRQIAQASELRARLALIRDDLQRGGQPQMADWLKALGLMATYGKYFSASELRSILESFRKIEPDFETVMGEVRALMEAGGRPDSPQAQALARRWMGLIHHWMGGDFELMERWERMYIAEPTAHGRRGGPPTDMLEFMRAASAVRMDALRKYFTLEELARIRFVAQEEWDAVVLRARELMAAGTPARSRQPRALAARWMALMQQLMGGDAQLVQRLFEAAQSEPVLRAGSAIPEDVRDYLRRALDPHAA